MSEAHLARTSAQAYRRLGLHGQAVVTSYPQLANILARRLDREHASFLAVPKINPATGDIDWYAPRSGPVRKAADVPEPAQIELRARAAQIRNAIGQLAERLKQEGPTAELVGRMLEETLKSPVGDWLYEVDGKPTQIMWGHAPGGAERATAPAVESAPTAQHVAGADPAAAAAATVAPAPVPPISPASTAEPTAIAAWRTDWRRWLLWLLPLVLVLASLIALRSCRLSFSGQDDEGIRVPRTFAERVALEQDRENALRRELDALLRQQDAGNLKCAPADPFQTQPTPELQPEQKREPQQPPDVAEGKALSVPEEATKSGKLDFLEGLWRAGNEQLKLGNRPAEVYLRFDRDGKGEMIGRYRDDGSECRGPLHGRMEGDQLRIETPQALKCDKGGFIQPQNIECVRTPDGRTICNGINKQSGVRYGTDIVRAR